MLKSILKILIISNSFLIKISIFEGPKNKSSRSFLLYLIMKEKETIIVDGMSYGERELAQLIRRRMMTQEVKNKKKYTRKSKHKKAWDI